MGYETSKTVTKKMSNERRKLVLEMTSMQARLIHANLPITARAMHNAVRAVGWELAGDTEKAARHAA